jgi:hypothetical protein
MFPMGEANGIHQVCPALLSPAGPQELQHLRGDMLGHMRGDMLGPPFVHALGLYGGPCLSAQLGKVRRLLLPLTALPVELRPSVENQMSLTWAIANQQPRPEGVKALRAGWMQFQELPIPQASQDLAGTEGVEANQLPQAGVVHLSLTVGLKQGPEFLLAEFF